ncbi:MAG: hypothetical protein QW569_04380 [Candidatus Bathyarchaeia archaeon]|nr:hypothetical protein [Candidatus Bathyarchaeota archaeon]
MSLLNTFKFDKNLKRFAVDSIAHTIFYGVLGAVIALALGIELKVYLAMSIIGTAIQIVSGGFFGRFLDLVRRLMGV